MATQRKLRNWLAAGGVVGVFYACSGHPDAVLRPQGGDDTDGGEGAVSGRGGSAATGGTIIVTRGGTTGKGGKGGGGTAANAGEGGDDGQGGFRDAGLPDSRFDYDASYGGQGGACENVTGDATLVKRPMDIVISIDNSQSMQGEIQAVQARINTDFAQIIQASMIDYRVIVVSRYGNVYINNQDGGVAQDSAYPICIGGPLSSLTCPGNSGATTPAVVHNPPRFYHHSTDIGSNNMWCRLLGSYSASDPYPVARSGFTAIAPSGWGAFLRPQAFKVFIGITDDSPTGSTNTYSRGGQQLTLGCPNMLGDSSLDGTNDQAGATDFDTALRTLAPTQFGALSGERNYSWYSIVGMAGNATSNPTPLAPSDPVQSNCCRANGTVQTSCQGNSAPDGDGAGNGVGYQQLSILTGGLRYPSCYNGNFNSIFNAIAQGVIEGSRASCEYDVPVSGSGIIDPNQTVVSYRVGGVPPGTQLGRVASDTACGAGGGYYFSQDLQKIFLCPTTCTTVQADTAARINIDFGCLGS